MAGEQFEYKGKQVGIQMMQPMTGDGRLWQADIAGSRLEPPRRTPIKHRQDALQYATMEEKEAIDREGQVVLPRHSLLQLAARSERRMAGRRALQGNQERAAGTFTPIPSGNNGAISASSSSLN